MAGGALSIFANIAEETASVAAMHKTSFGILNASEDNDGHVMFSAEKWNFSLRHAIIGDGVSLC